MNDGGLVLPASRACRSALRPHVLSILLVALAAAGCTFGERKDAGGSAGGRIPTARAARGEFRETIEEVGLLKARISGRVVPAFTSTVKKLVPEGTKVQPGDPVLWLDTEEQERDLEQREAQLRGAESDYQKQVESIAMQRKSTRFDIELSEANLEFSRKKLASAESAAADAERQAKLGLVSLASRDQKQRELEQTRLDAQQAELAHLRRLEEVGQRARGLDLELTRAEQARAWSQRAVDDLRRDMAGAVLRAPSAGVVYYPAIRLGGRWGGGAQDERRKIRVGDRIGPWREAPLELPDRSSMEVISQVDESLMSRVQPGVPVVVTVTALEGLQITGKVKSLGALAMARSRAEGAGFVSTDANAVEQVVVPVTVELDSIDDRLQPGMTVAVSYVLQVLPDAVSVPVDAVFGDDRQPVVFVRTADGGHEQRAVTLGPASGGRVVVKSGLLGTEDVFLGDPRSADAAKPGLAP